MCEFRGVMVFPQTCRKVCEGCDAGELCAMERREEEEEEEFGDTTLESAAPPPLPHFPPPDGLRARAFFFPCPAALAVAAARLARLMTVP
jgi:hypothetical protein